MTMPDDDAIFTKLAELLQDHLGIKGKHVCVTGKLVVPRKDAHRLIRDYGGIPQDRVTKETDWLVVGGKPGGTKVFQAIKYGIPVISEQDLWANLGSGMSMEGTA